jgi:hypothetical protein
MSVSCAEVTSLADLRIQLAEAELAYHRLMSGRQPRVVVDSNGERIEFTAVSAAGLRSYIQDLQRRIGLLTGCNGGPIHTRPIRFFF